MPDSLDQFLARAKMISLSLEEKQFSREFLTSLIRAGNVQLEKEEREEGRNALRLFMDAHPRSSSLFPLHTHAFLSPLFSSLLSVRLASFAMVCVLLGSVGGGVAYAAEDALPGDALYSFKTNISEPLRERLHFSREGKARFAAHRIHRRLGEVQKLYELKELTPQHLERIQEHMQHHMERMDRRLASLPDDNEHGEEMRAHLQDALQAHEEFLMKVEEGSASPEDVRAFHDAMRKNRERVKGWKRDKKKPRLEFREPFKRNMHRSR